MAVSNSWGVPLIAFSIFLLGRPYQGIIQDAYIYIGRALADLDPNGVGRDLMFVHDGQFGFSLFRFVAKTMVMLFGPAMAAKALAMTAAFAWFFAAFAFARAFASGPAAWTAVIFAALLPASYGPPSPFGFAELIAIPRPFAEALVLASLAALAARRDIARLLCLLLAALLHPIMALAGFGVLIVVRGGEDKRWFLVSGVAGALSIVAAVFNVPLFDRLLLPVDSAFRDSYELQKAALFPTLWPIESFPPLIVQSVTIAIAAHLQQGRGRQILAAIIVAGLGGIAIAAIFGDWLSSLLIVQAQPWRTAWLMSAAGAMSLGFCSVELWRRGPASRIVLALLVLAWSLNMQLLPAGPAMLTLSLRFGMQSVACIVAAVLALFFHFGEERYAPLLKSHYVLGVWVFTIALAAVWIIPLIIYPVQLTIAAPAGYANLSLVGVRDLLAIPLCALAAYLAIGESRTGLHLLRYCAFILLPAAVWFWDHRTPAQRVLEEERPSPELMRVIDRHQGEVLWIGGLAEAWFFLRRPQWESPLQRGPTIFSSVLTAEWRSRTQALIALQLINRNDIAPWKPFEAADRPRVTPDHVRQLCAQSGAPAWIIAPLDHATEPRAGFDMKIWQLREPLFKPIKGDGSYLWQKIEAYGFIACGSLSKASMQQ